MKSFKLQIPDSPSQELYFDNATLLPKFRDRVSQKDALVPTAKVLRIVIFAYGRVVEDRFFNPGSVITVGSSKKVTFKIPAPDLPEGHPLITYNADRSVTLSLSSRISGILQKQDKLETLAPAAPTQHGERVLSLPPQSKGVLEIGNLSIYFEEIDDPEKIVPLPFSKMLSDPQFVRWVVLSAGFHVASLIVIALLPTPIPPPIEPEKLAEVIEQQSKRFERLPVRVKQWQPSSGGKASSASAGRAGEGAKAPGAEGLAGKGRATGGKTIKPFQKKDLNTMGVLPFLSSGKGAFSKLVGASQGLDQAAENIGATADRSGLASGQGVREGKGLKGDALGGGGKYASMGRSGLGQKGSGVGRSGQGTGLAEMGTGRGTAKVAVNSPTEDVFIGGSIPKEVIDRIIREHLGEIRYCYEREVQVKPELRGKIITDFVIGLQGRVTSARVKEGSTIADNNVEQCVLRVIRRLEFPKPGAGTVQVFYPFLFRVAG